MKNAAANNDYIERNSCRLFYTTNVDNHEFSLLYTMSQGRRIFFWGEGGRLCQISVPYLNQGVEGQIMPNTLLLAPGFETFLRPCYEAIALLQEIVAIIGLSPVTFSVHTMSVFQNLILGFIIE